MPALRSAAQLQGLLLALDRRTFTEAYDEVMDLARVRGALYLDDHVFAEMEEWIAKEITCACDKFEPSVQERRDIVNRVAADIAQCEAAWTTM